MIVAVLAVLGLGLGSFVNALVWRVYEQEKEGGKAHPDKKYLRALSISRGRSICTHCHHKLAAKDLIPLLSWLSLSGKCRYCGKPISVRYPLVELLTAVLFVVSYLFWPVEISGGEVIGFGLWLMLLTGFMALTVYDLKWMLLPDRIMRPLAMVAALFALVAVFMADQPFRAVLNVVLAVLVGGGLFYVLFQVSKGKWIGGGDVKLGALLGLVVATPARSVLLIFLASLTGSLVSLPFLAAKRLKPTSTIPLGPFLILAAVIVQLVGHDILDWYQRNFLPFSL